MKSWTKWILLAFLLCILPLPAGAAASQTKGTGEWNPKPTERWLEVVKKERRLYLRQGEKVLKTFRVAIGSGKGTKKSPIDKVTPVGIFTIRRIADPTNWIFDPKVFNEPGEPQKDVYGKWAISFRNPWNLAIHGTNAPWSIGKAVTHGCIRLKNSDIEELVKHVKPGMKLVIREKPLMAAKNKETASTSAKPLPTQETGTGAVSAPAEPAALPSPTTPGVEDGTQSPDLGLPAHPSSQDVDGNKSQDVGSPAVPSDQRPAPQEESNPEA